MDHVCQSEYIGPKPVLGTRGFPDLPDYSKYNKFSQIYLYSKKHGMKGVDIAEKLYISPSAVSQALKKIEKMIMEGLKLIKN